MNKYGIYIQKLMTVVLDKDQDEFVQQMAWNELRRLGEGVNEFLSKHSKDDSDQKKNTEKMLLQENENDKNTK